MKPAVSILAVFAAVLVWSFASGQEVKRTGGVRLLSAPSGSPSNAVFASILSKGFPGSTTNYPFRSPGTNPPEWLRVPGALSNTVGRLKPGVYETHPYTCIVVVPGGYPDEKSLIDGGQAAEHMPTLKPDLQFTPRTAK